VELSAALETGQGGRRAAPSAVGNRRARQQTSAMGSTLGPAGDSLRHALKWVSDRRREQPQLPLGTVLDEAALQFDLTPLEQEFLSNALRQPPPAE
jgi:hypothetical protein